MRNVNSDVAYDYIRKRILSGEFSPGSGLLTNVLSAQIGVSRTPVRDALRQLEADGLVTIQPRLGASVKRMDMKEFREMCELRLALESYAAALAAKNRTDMDLREMQFAVETMQRLTDEIEARGHDKEHLDDVVREDVRFHVAVIGAAKNELIKREILRLHLINRVVSGPTPGDTTPEVAAERSARRRLVLSEHQAILDAVKRSDSAAARNAMEQHIQGIIDHSLIVLGGSAKGYVARQLTEEELSYTA